MEFFLVPLLAIAALTFCIYKLAELLFHIHLSCRLMILLVGFAWLISLVLPKLFFHSVGFLGSISLSLVSAVGFAWLATVYDIRTQASQPISIGNASEQLMETADVWIPPAEVAVPVEALILSVTPAEEKESESETVLPEIIVAEAVEVEVAEIEVAEFEEPEEPEQLDEPEQPVSDSLEDLLDFAFAQRDKHQEAATLDTFRLIKHLYSDNDALPMVVAEIVSTLQSQGDYAGAIAELTEILQLPEVRKHGHLVQAFELKLTELRTNTTERSNELVQD